MALQIPLLADDSLVGFDFPEAYAKIEFAREYASKSYIWVNWYANEAARRRHEIDRNPAPVVEPVVEPIVEPVVEESAAPEGDAPVEEAIVAPSIPAIPDPSTLIPPLPPAQPVKQQEFVYEGSATTFPGYYEYLKTQPEFAGAVDV